MIVNRVLNLFLQVILSGILRAVLVMSAIGSTLATNAPGKPLVASLI